MKKYIPLYTILLLLCFCSNTTWAQKDTLQKISTIDITSPYKPVLRNAVKINFAAANLNADTSLPKINYTVPAQNLFYSYQPIALKPLALQQDTNLNLGIRNYLKLGIGNFSTPYLSGGFSFGDGKKSLLNLYADYISSKGKIKYQNYSQLNIKAAGSYFINTNEVYGSVHLSNNDTYLYGYDHALYNFSKDSIRNQYQNINLSAGVKNTIIGDYGIQYNPHVQVNVFSNKNKLTESSLVIVAPIKKQISEAMAITLQATTDITSYTTKNLNSNVKFSNNIFQLAPSLSYTSTKVNINGGLIPTWDNGAFVWLPNIYAEWQVQEKIFMLQAGWIGTYNKNSFQNLYNINPYLQPILFAKNTKEIEYYGGLKASINKHFTFSAKAGFVSLTNMPLFINDTATDNKSFKVAYENKAGNIRIHGDLSYINQDKFTITAGLTLNGYTGFDVNKKPWNTIPMELSGSLRWWAYKQVLLKADVYAFGGGNYLSKNTGAESFGGGTDVSAGAEFKINKKISAWMDINNIFNSPYQRWHNYQVYGLNVLGGVKIYF